MLHTHELTSQERNLFHGWLYQRRRCFPAPRWLRGALGIGGLLLIVAALLHQAGIVVLGGTILAVVTLWSRNLRLNSSQDWERPIPRYAMERIGRVCSARTKDFLDARRRLNRDGVLRFSDLDKALAILAVSGPPVQDAGLITYQRAILNGDQSDSAGSEPHSAICGSRWSVKHDTAYCWFTPNDDSGSPEGASQTQGWRGVPVRALQSILEAAPCVLVGLRCARDGNVSAIAVEYESRDEYALLGAARLAAGGAFTALWRSAAADPGHRTMWARTDSFGGILVPIGDDLALPAYFSNCRSINRSTG